MGCCITKSLDYQQLPLIGSLSCKLNYSFGELLASLNSRDLLEQTVYYYVMTSVEKHDNTFRHKGSGPNWQGGIITLCTCKHQMRTYPECKRGTWVAGFSTVCACDDGINYLVYLMRVGQTFESHYDLWSYLSEEVRESKSANANQLGDVYRPLGRETQEAPFDPEKYHKPCQGHRHKKDYDKDIYYINRRSERRASLLVGDVKYSFLWDQYMTNIDHNIGRGQRKSYLMEFLSHLQDTELRR